MYLLIRIHTYVEAEADKIARTGGSRRDRAAHKLEAGAARLKAAESEKEELARRVAAAKAEVQQASEAHTAGERAAAKRLACQAATPLQTAPS